MKKYSILILVLVLTAVLLIGCGCRNNKPMNTVPTTVPTTETTRPTTEATTEMTTEATIGTEQTDATIDNGNGPLPTEESGIVGDQDQARRIPGAK